MQGCNVFHYPPCEHCGKTPAKPRRYSYRLDKWVCHICYVGAKTNGSSTL